MSMLPTTSRGVVAIVGVLFFVLIVMYASTLGTILVGAVLLFVLGWLAVSLIYRVDYWLKHGSFW